MSRMNKAFAYLSFLVSGLFALWFVAGWVDGIRSDGLSETAYTLLHWPAVTLTVGLPVSAIGCLCIGLSLLSRDDRR